MSSHRRVKAHGLIFLVDFLFIVCFWIVLEPAPGVAIKLDAPPSGGYLKVVDIGSGSRGTSERSSWSMACSPDLRAACAENQRVVVHGPLFTLISELYFVSCAFGKKRCRLVISLTRDGRVDGERFLRENPTTPEVAFELKQKFINNPDLIK
jgi:hypothetical protein